MKLSRIGLFIVVVVLLTPDELKGCLWDRDTLADERKKSPQMAELIFGPNPKPPDPVSMRDRIASLRSQPRESETSWWNDLAGAYIRMGAPDEAAKLLESIVAKFPDDYGIHANLGTAYHLLGRYREAEREIARDLELNPAGHFGLEKYHLALLQYLSSDADYQKQHVYVDEFSDAFTNEWHELFLMESPNLVPERDNGARRAAYRSKWNLATDTNLHAGVIYMASLNPKEPACFVMLGVAGLQDQGLDRDLNLAMAAFEKACRLGSPQEALLRAHIAQINAHIREAGPSSSTIITSIMLGAAAVVVISLVGAIIFILRRKRASRRKEEALTQQVFSARKSS